MKGRSDDNVDQVLLAQYRAAQHRLGEARSRVDAAPRGHERDQAQAEYDMRYVRLRELRQRIEDAR
jgi:hypothetical protein